MPKIGQRYAKGIVKSLSNLKNMKDLLTDSPTGIQENTIRDGGSTGLLHCFHCLYYSNCFTLLENSMYAYAHIYQDLHDFYAVPRRYSLI